MNYADQLIQLLPPGRLWAVEPGTEIRLTMQALGDELERVRLRGVDLVNESDPRTATETIAEWEQAVGIPDEQIPVIAGTLAGRRTAVVTKLAARGGQRIPDFQAVFTAAGYDAPATNQFQTFATKVLKAGFYAGDLAYGEEYAYAMWIQADPYSAGPGALSTTQVDAVIRAMCHSHITVLVVWAF